MTGCRGWLVVGESGLRGSGFGRAELLSATYYFGHGADMPEY